MTRTRLGLAALLPALWIATAASPAGAEGGLYRFVDARGVVHYTNRPSDGRYERLRGPSRSGSPSPASSRAFDRVIVRASLAHGIPPALVKAVIHAESAFDPGAVSRKGAMGLMQLMPDTAQALGVARPFIAEENVRGGTRYLRDLHERYGSWTFTLAAYNAGPAAVDRYRGVPPYAETRQYVRKVLSYYRRYHGDFPR